MNNKDCNWRPFLMMSTPSKIDKDSARSHAFTKSLFCGSMSFHCRANDQNGFEDSPGFFRSVFLVWRQEKSAKTPRLLMKFCTFWSWKSVEWKEGLDWHNMFCFCCHFFSIWLAWRFINYFSIVCPKQRRVDGSHGTRSWRESSLFRGFSTFRCETQTNKNHFQEFLVATAFVWLWFETCFSQVDTISARTRTPWVWLLKKQHVGRALLLGGWSVSKTLKDLSTALNLQKTWGAE